MTQRTSADRHRRVVLADAAHGIGEGNEVHPIVMAAGAAQWLVSREIHPRVAREEWMRDKPAMLRTGVHFDAIRLPARAVHFLAGGEDRDSVESVFREAGIDSAVIADPPRGWYYVLVPPGTTIASNGSGFEVLGESHYLGVPSPHRAEPPGTYWLLTPPDDERALCDPCDVEQLISASQQ